MSSRPIPPVNCPPALRITENVPMAHVANVDASVEFYTLLGFHCASRFSDHVGVTNWAAIESAKARMFLNRASGPIVAGDQAVLFYMYSADVRSLREHLLAQGIPDAGNPPGESDDCGPGPAGAAVYTVVPRFYMPDGELRVHDPDGYVILVGQLG